MCACLEETGVELPVADIVRAVQATRRQQQQQQQQENQQESQQEN